jgi:hypothetical protein
MMRYYHEDLFISENAVSGEYGLAAFEVLYLKPFSLRGTFRRVGMHFRWVQSLAKLASGFQTL